MSSDIITTKTVLHDIAAQAYNLAMGLQNAAPTQASSKSTSASIQYLKEISIELENASQKIAEMGEKK